MAPPVVFLSHAAEDRALVERLAKDLMAAGIHVWYSEWEIGIGDSLRRKIDAGIDSATHFLVLLSPASLGSEWVQTELDAGLVNKISGACKLLPVLHEIEAHQVPATLRGLKWVRLTPYDDGLRALVDACHGVSRKPTVGAVPAWASERPLPDSGLSAHAQRLVAFLNQHSEHGTPWKFAAADDLLRELGMTPIQLGVAAGELNDLALVRLIGSYGAGETGFHQIAPGEFFFAVTDAALQDWDPEEDARQLAAALVNMKATVVNLDAVDELLGWGPRRMNAAAAYLVMNAHAKPLKTHGSGNYLYRSLHVTHRTHLFTES
jgi:hypothetical protein